MIELNLDDLNEDDVYKAFEVDGNEGEALNDIYLGPAEKVIFDENLLNICKNTVRHMCIGCI